MSALEEIRRRLAIHAAEYMKLSSDFADLEQRVANVKEKVDKQYKQLDSLLDKEQNEI